MRITNLNTFRSRYWKAAIFVALLAAWVSVPLFTNNVIADSLAVMSGTQRWANLVSPVGASDRGVVDWELDDNGRRRIEYNLSNLTAPAGTVLTAVVNGNAIGTFAVSSFQSGYLRLRTQDGQAVPDVQVGTITEIRRGSAVVVSGVFENGSAPTPSPSVSPTSTGTSSPTPSVSPTGTSSPTPSVSPTGTSSPTPSVSPTGTSSPTPSVSPTGTSSPTPSVSPTGTSSPTPSVSPTTTPSPSGTPENEIYAILNGPTINGTLPRGFAEYEIHSSRTELEVRLNQINLPTGTSLSVIVNGVATRNLVLQSGGEGRLRLRSDQGDIVPVVSAGSVIIIKNGAATIMTGTFVMSGVPTPSPSGTPLGRFFEGKMTRPGIPSTATGPKGELKVTLNAAESQAVITGEYSRLTSAQISLKITVEVGSTTTVIYDFGTLGGIERRFGPVTVNVTPQQVQQLRMSLWKGTVGTVNNPLAEIQGFIGPNSSSSDFNGDGGDDLAVYRPSNGTFFIDAPNGYTTQVLGRAGDKIVSGDYDGDGKTDTAVYSNVGGQGVWTVQRSSDGGVTTTQFGLATDTTVRGDFDGDGRSDLAVYRSSTGIWYVEKSNGTGQVITRFGLSGDIPLGADFDGDGKDDIAVFRPSNGIWYWTNSSDGSLGVVQFGLNGDVPIAGDFDGDGVDDISIFRPSTGVWYIWHSSDQSYDIRQFGLNGDIPVAGRYDGDTKTDIAVFRPSTGVWYIWRSSDNSYDYRNFGLNGDIPLIAR